jgi:glycogen debranching enzyme
MLRGHTLTRDVPLPAPAAAEAVVETPFYIPATGPSTRPRRTLKHGDTFAVFDAHGDIGATAEGPDGIYHADTRYLSRLELLINGMQPLLLGSNVRDDNSLLTVDLTNPDIYFDKKLVLPKDTIHILRTIFLLRNTAYQRLAIHNHGEQPVNLHLALSFATDFADLFEVRGMRRERRGLMRPAQAGEQEVLLSYEGLDRRLRQTLLHFDPVPTQIGATIGSYSFTLQPGQSRALFVGVECNAERETRQLPFPRGLRAAFRDIKASTQGAATIDSSNTIFNQVMCRSTADLYMLVTQTAQGPYPYAGIPWYSTTFGRDGIITAMQTLWCDPGIAKGVLSRLAALQAKSENPLADGQPGKILHEMRGGEMAALREVPFELYYGSVDSTPLFVWLAGLYAQRTGDMETLDALWSHIEAALAWIDGPGDPDGDGFVEYYRMTEQGLANQGWKDSQDAIFHADGHLAEGPIALAEVQGYVFAAKRAAAYCARALGRHDQADALEQAAAALAERFEESFWCEEIETYALALDGKKRACAVRTSNAGQLLFSGMIKPERARLVMEGLMRPQFFNGWGIRTVGKEEARYNPMSYHNGSVWPHDNALIALGFARYGFRGAVERVFRGMFNAASYMDLMRLPELFCGFRRARGQAPTLYPVACAPQAWASATPFALLGASLGLEFEPLANEIRLRNPQLPAFLDEVILRNLRLGQSGVDLRLRRHDEEVSVQVIRSQGQVRVSAVYS